MPATSNPARSAGRHDMEGRGYDLIIFAPARLVSSGTSGQGRGCGRKGTSVPPTLVRGGSATPRNGEDLQLPDIK